MNNQEKDLELLKSTREIVSQALGLTVTNDITKKVLNGESISIDELTKEHTLTEIGNALIRLDTFPKIISEASSTSEMSEASSTSEMSEASSTSELRVGIGPWWWNIMPINNG